LNLNALQQIAVTGNKEAEKKLFETLRVRFYLLAQQRIMNKDDCEEVVQNTLTAIAEKYKSVDFRKSFTAWVYSIFENNVKNYYRTKRYHLSKLGRLQEETIPEEVKNPDPILKSKLIDCLKKVIRRNLRYARILNLYNQGYSGEDISRKMKITRNNVYMLFTRARSSLKKCLEGQEEF
jgi:RNA polymerase sigma factor (sigma-70 family)